MKLIYVIAQSHTGSTLLDCILGVHPEFQSTGEFKHLSWQLYRTLTCKGTPEEGSACSCGHDFRECEVWSEVLSQIQTETGINMAMSPYQFDISFFNQKSYQGRGGFKRSKWDIFQSAATRLLLEKGFSYSRIKLLFPELKKWLENTWRVYNVLANVTNKKVIIDSSKDRTLALLHKSYNPANVHLVFLHRSLKGIVASGKRLAKKKNKVFSLDKIIQEKKLFEQMVSRYKKILKNKENYLDNLRRNGSRTN